MRYTDSMLGGIRILCRGGIGYPCRCGARRGAEPARHWLFLPLWCPQGGLPSLSPAAPVFSFLFAPYPPAPLPRWGRGRPKVYFAGGSAPCIPGIKSFAAFTEPAKQVPAGGACLPCRPPPPPLTCFPAPYPPSPLPLRGRGRPKVYFAGGFAPGSPALDRLRHLQNLPSRCPAGGAVVSVACLPCRCGTRRGACPLCRLPPLPLAFFSAPYPPAPLPRWGRGRFFCFLMQGAPPLASPALDRLRHLQSLPSRCQAGGLALGVGSSAGVSGTRRGRCG